MSRATKNGTVEIVRSSDNAIETARLQSFAQTAVHNMKVLAQARQPEPATFVPERGQLVRAADGRGIHIVVKVSGVYFSAECGRAYRIGEPSQPGDLANACAFCADGSIAPPDSIDDRPAKTRTPRAAKPAHVLTEQELEATAIALEASYSELAGRIELSAGKLREWLNEHAVITDLVEYRNVLKNALGSVSELRPVGKSGHAGVTGPKAPRGTYDVTPDRETDSPELATIRAYANKGDERAQSIIAHVDSWVDADGEPVSTQDKLGPLPGASFCSYCKSEKHLRRTGFFSAAREIVKMAERAGIVETVAA